MIDIGGRPILWHIMKIYAHHGVDDFIICLGYRGYMIKEYFANYVLHSADVTVDLGSNSVEYHANSAEPWRITLVDTGEDTMTGGRIKRIGPYLDNEPFCLTYGDGVADMDITAEIEVHKRAGRAATMAAVSPPGRFGAAELEADAVARFTEKPSGDGGVINGGFFVCEPEVLDRIGGDETVWEQEPLQGLAADGQLTAYPHNGFWQPMDTMRERIVLEDLWATGTAPWKVWD